MGNRIKVEDSQGGVTTSIYNAVNLLTQRQFGGVGQTPLRFDQTYTARDELSGVLRYSDLAGSTLVGTSSYVYDNVGNTTSIVHKDGSGTTLLALTYTYDLAHRLSTDNVDGALHTYTYDNTNQLTGDGTDTFAFDLNGNPSGGGFTVTTGNLLTSDGTWTYTNNDAGQRTKKSLGASAETWTYSYDTRGQMDSAEQRATDGGTLLLKLVFTYDVDGRLITQERWTSGTGTLTTRYGYDTASNNVWVDLDGSNTLLTRYLRPDGMDALAARINAAGSAGWHLTDRQGTILGNTNAAGALANKNVYNSYGKLVSQSNAAASDAYGYTGKVYQADLQFSYHWHRWYDTITRRWTTLDPIGFQAGDFNLQRYVGNGPTNGTDPTGLSELDALLDQWQGSGSKPSTSNENRDRVLRISRYGNCIQPRRDLDPTVLISQHESASKPAFLFDDPMLQRAEAAMKKLLDKIFNMPEDDVPRFAKGIFLGFIEDGLWDTVTTIYEVGKFGFLNCSIVRVIREGLDREGVRADDEKIRKCLTDGWSLTKALANAQGQVCQEAGDLATVLATGDRGKIEAHFNKLSPKMKAIVAVVAETAVTMLEKAADSTAEQKGRLVGMVLYELTEDSILAGVTAGAAALGAGPKLLEAARRAARAAGLSEEQIQQVTKHLDEFLKLLSPETMPGSTLGKPLDGAPPRAQPPSAPVRVASNSVPDNPYFTRIDPTVPGRPDPKFSIDTKTFSGGELTSNGGLRNTKEFWQQWQKLRPESLSKSNRYLIENYDKLKVSPRIDDEWIKVFPEHAPFKGDLIIHHHVDFERYAIPVPGKTHVGSGGVWHTK